MRCAYIHGKSELHRIAYTFGTFHLPAGSPIWYRFCQGDFRLPASSRAKIDPYMRMHMGADPHGCHEEHPYMRRHDLEHIRRRCDSVQSMSTPQAQRCRTTNATKNTVTIPTLQGVFLPISGLLHHACRFIYPCSETVGIGSKSTLNTTTPTASGLALPLWLLGPAFSVTSSSGWYSGIAVLDRSAHLCPALLRLAGSLLLLYYSEACLRRFLAHSRHFLPSSEYFPICIENLGVWLSRRGKSTPALKNEMSGAGWYGPKDF